MRKMTGFFARQGVWQKILKAAQAKSTAFHKGATTSHLQEIPSFGSNPGELRMFTHVPASLSPESALVVVLHGCTQSAAGYDIGAGWSTLADRFGFALLLPEQTRSNNSNGCFNWFLPGDTKRGQGEALSIRQMVHEMIVKHGIDPKQVFITGLSAGGAMASVMLATYPDVFAGGAVIAGLPYGAANNVQQAFETMFQCRPRSPRDWGDFVRAASPHKGPWPRISIWHGGADATVIPSNAKEIVKQWTNVHGLPTNPTVHAIVDGYPRQLWINDEGAEIIESYNITNMAHGTPLATGAGEGECGAAGPFLLEVGISSSYHIAKFFGLTKTLAPHAESTTIDIRATAAAQDHGYSPTWELEPAHVLDGEVLDPLPADKSAQKSAKSSTSIDIGAVINNALKAAGLVKDR
jgi:poly(hydroxyalkanoate) depolymerase family esterase